MAAAVDTLKTAKELQAAGMELSQAEAVARAVGAVGIGEHLATKSDLYKVVLGAAIGVVGLNATVTFGMLKLML